MFRCSSLGCHTFEFGRWSSSRSYNECDTHIHVQNAVVYQTHFDNQTLLPVSVYKGERTHVMDNNFLGGFDLPVPMDLRGKEPVDVCFEIRYQGDIEGLD